jgi:hypothetical protein
MYGKEQVYDGREKGREWNETIGLNQTPLITPRKPSATPQINKARLLRAHSPALVGTWSLDLVYS